MRAIGYETYKMFAVKYGIKLTRPNGKDKEMKQLSKEIYKYETENQDKIGEIGLYYY